MAPIFCYRCGDAVEEGCDPRDELAELDDLMERLRLKRYDLKRKINRFHSPIVCQLPPDVTSTIFEFCLPDVTDYPLSPYVEKTFSIPFSPLSLGAICSYWRDIAWSTPSLWSSLAVHNPDEYNSHTVTGIAREWLTRSGQLPLSIFILSTSHNKTVLALVDIINQYSTRWSNLDLCIPDSYYQHFHASDNHSVIHTPILKSIRLHHSANPSGNLNFQLTSCHHLERASLSYIPMDGSNIHWDNLTHLTLNSMSFTDVFHILRKTPRLVFCQVSGFYPSFREQIIGPPVVSSMKSLQLHLDSEKFLDNLIAPHLEEFKFSKYYIPGIEVFITSFFRRSACSLRSLSMSFTITISQYLEGFMNSLQSMPSLTTLSIISKPTPDPEDNHPRNILRLLAKVISSQSTSLQRGFLPNLKILEYTGELYLHPGNYDDIYPLPPVDNAVHGPLHLFKLDLYPATRISGSMISYISSLAKRGVTVNVVSRSEDILQYSIDYHRCRLQDWSDNLDLSLLS